MSSVLLVAAEASSALFAQRLLEHWKKEKQHVQAFGVGSDAMEALGFERLGKSEEMAVVGIAEIIEHFGKLRSIFHALVAEAEKRRPKVAIIMDYPDFNLMLCITSRRRSGLGEKVACIRSKNTVIASSLCFRLKLRFLKKSVCLANSLVIRFWMNWTPNISMMSTAGNTVVAMASPMTRSSLA